MAKYYKGLESSADEVQTTIKNNKVYINSSSDEFIWEFQDIKFQRLSSTFIRLCHISGACIQLGESEFIDIKDLLPSQLQGHSEKFKLWHYGIVILSIVLIIHFSLDSITNTLSKHITPEMEASLVSKAIGYMEDKNLAEDEHQIGLERALEALGENPDEYRIFIIDMKEVNAFALPGKHIVFTTSIFNFFKNQDEFMAVLAHELQHVKQRHHLRGFLKGLITTTAWSLTIGMLTDTVGLNSKFVQDLALSKYSSLEEEEADRLAVKMLVDSKLSTRGGMSFFKRLEEKHEDNILYKLSLSHPDSGNRVKVFTTANTNLIDAMSESQWQKLKDLGKKKEK